MRLKVIALALASVLSAGLWPLPADADESPVVREFREQRLREHLQQQIKRAFPAPNIPAVAPQVTQVTVPPGFFGFTWFSGFTDSHGFVAFPMLLGFPPYVYVVERSLNRVARSLSGPPVPFATGLSAPLDLLPAPGFGSGPFGNFLYVTETGANRISRINTTGAVTPFVSFTSAPRRMAFSPDLGAFGTPAAPLLFVTLADGRIVKVSPTGTVTPCVSGLSGPEGLVFGPGGSSFKNVLYVAERTGNRISKVSPACTASPFASTGLNSPVGLGISPGGGWGPLDTLYVGNAMTRVDRVSGDAIVTPFASGFQAADTLRLPAFPFSPSSRPCFDRLCLTEDLLVSDAAAGTTEGVFVDSPFAFPEITGCNPCRPGDTFAVALTVENQSPLDLPVEIKTGFRLPDGTPVNFSPLANKHFEAVLPRGFRFQGPWVSLPMPPVPPGTYCYEAWISDPEVGMFVFGLYDCFDVLP